MALCRGRGVALMAAYRGADAFRAPTDQVYGPYASLHLSGFGESSGFDRFVSSLHVKDYS